MIECESVSGKVIGHEWDQTKADRLGSELTHVEITATSTDPTLGDVIELDEIPVSPSLYPQENIDVEVYKNNNNELWAIGTDSKGQLWTFYQKPNFGDYLIASIVSVATKNKSSRVSQKLQSGYQPISQTLNYCFDHGNRDIAQKF
ncbi:hypothetical protein C9975_02990 [Thalassospira xiamenensis]|nr:hypothetical protein C9975_02990 [Thalassospira xiamenensis]